MIGFHRCSRVFLLSGAFVLITSAFARDPEPIDAQVIVIGGGIAGLSSALEASANGARVLIIESSSVAGGHAVKAGGLALVGTPLQESKGFKDSPEIAYDDLMNWGEDADPTWVRLFTETSRHDIHDWLVEFGVEFTVLRGTPESTVPRFHFAGGSAAHVVVPMLREAMQRTNLDFVMNTEAQSLAIDENGFFVIRTRNGRSGREHDYVSPSLVIATGGFESNLDLVRRNFHETGIEKIRAPKRLLIGSGQYATGSAIRLGRSVNAKLSRMDHQVIFISGLTDPRNPQHGLYADNPMAIRIDANGRRFVDEAANSKIIEAAVMSLDKPEHWLIFDNKGLQNMIIRGAVWLNRDTIEREIFDNPAVVQRQDTLDALAKTAGLPANQLRDTIERYNAFVAAGEDKDFGRFGPKTRKGRMRVRAITDPPYFAVHLLPMTRKSMGGLAIDTNARVLGQDGRTIDGLFAAGEATGVAGINGSHGGSGTFLAPSVLTGRIAGRNAALHAQNQKTFTVKPNPEPAQSMQPVFADGRFPEISAEQLRSRLEHERAGYWHWERSHAIVLERALACTNCHSSEWPAMPARTTSQQLLQLETCTRCH